VHILLDLLGLLIAIVLGNALLLRLLRLSREWSQRQILQLLVLMTPLASIIVLLGGIQHTLNPACALNAPAWDDLLDKTTLLLVGSGLMGALGLGVGRLVLMKRVIREQETLPDSALQVLVDHFSQQYNYPRPKVRVAHSNRSFAFLYGIRRPTIVLSTWILGHLDQQELEAVIMHELAHVYKRHFLLNWFALLLRDAFFYLPTSRIAYRQFHEEKELACDDLVVQATGRPLALASALTKVWLHLVDDEPTHLAQTLLTRDKKIAVRVERLLNMRNQTSERRPMRFSPLRLSTFVSISVLNITMGLALVVALLNC
jgi:Zn-dependent protease with chaperone function